MPTYEYQCKTCAHGFERFQKMADPPVSECPECGNSVRKLIHPPAIAFKGSGFYVNDYKGGGSKKPSSEPASESDKSAEAKSTSEKKPDTERKAETAKPADN